jgi:L-asparaginase II
MPDYAYRPVLEVTRGKTVETIHFGAIAVVDSMGKLIASHGDPSIVTFLRSSAKPFQALPFMEYGGQEAFGLTPKEVALICSSHSGTDEHVATVVGIQKKTGVAESDLMCGVHAPFHIPTVEAMRRRGEQPTPNRHNCSGKHTGMLSFIRLKQRRGEEMPADIPYIDVDHPIQREILKAFADTCALKIEQVSMGIDGCSVPNFAAPLYNTAFGFARLCDPAGLNSTRSQACRTVVGAMTANPGMVGGPDSFDTHLMEASEGRILCKAGAEGFQALGLLPGALGPGSPGLGIAIKISDGDLGAHSRPAGDPHGHARPAVALEVLRQLGALSAAAANSLSEYGPTFLIRNWRKIEVGEARPCFKLSLENPLVDTIQ